MLPTQNVVVNDIYGWQHYRNRATIIVNKGVDSVYALMQEKTKPPPTLPTTANRRKGLSSEAVTE